jgi:hypothetical protein
MYLRTTARTNKDGSVSTYLQLAHNYRDPDTGRPKPHILYNFGRKESVDTDALRRLVHSINRFLGPADELASLVEESSGEAMHFIESRPMGAAWLLHGLWRRLGVGTALETLASAKGLPDADGVAGCIFAMVANRALEPLAKHATPEWLEADVFVPDVPADIYDERLYRAMDFLLSTGEELQRTVYYATADLLNLDVDLLLYDTTSSYFEMEADDEERIEREARWQAFDLGLGPEPTRPRPQVVNDPPFRLQGHSRDRRPDLSQVVVGLAVTRDGIPVRCWVWPGNTNDATTVAEAKASLRGWRLNRVVWAVDRGMVSEDNLKELQRGGAHYIAGERLRAGKKTVEAALSRAGRYQVVRDNLEVKEVLVGEGEARRRYVLVRNPAQVERDREERELILTRLEHELERLPCDGEEHTKAVCELVAHKTLGRYLKKDHRGRLVIDRKKVKAEERLDGKYLIVTSDDTLSAEDVAVGYKQLAEVERAWRTLKSDIDLRPMYHRKADRIRAHVLLCWLSLLLIRVTEVCCGHTWRAIRQEMDRLQRGVFEGPAGRFVQRTELSGAQAQYLKAVEVAPPPRFQMIEPAAAEDTDAASS